MIITGPNIHSKNRKCEIFFVLYRSIRLISWIWLLAAVVILSCWRVFGGYTRTYGCMKVYLDKANIQLLISKNRNTLPIHIDVFFCLLLFFFTNFHHRKAEEINYLIACWICLLTNKEMNSLQFLQYINFNWTKNFKKTVNELICVSLSEGISIYIRM